MLAGPYDPRQGDAAIVGSAYFDFGLVDRGNVLKASYGSWNQLRLLGITAPDDLDEETFAAFALRRTEGFGARRASESATANAQYGVDSVHTSTYVCSPPPTPLARRCQACSAKTT